MSQNNVHLEDIDVSDGKQTTNPVSRRQRDGRNCKQICCMQMFAVLVFALGVVGGICIGIYAYDHGDSNKSNININCQMNSQEDKTSKLQTTTPKVKTDAEQPGVCQNTSPVKDKRYENYIFAPLTAREMNKVANYLLSQSIISTKEIPHSLTQNFILYQCLQPPTKADALEYLDNSGVKPKRYAKVTLQRGAVPSPDVMEYKVGPLDGTAMSAVNLTKPGYIHFNSRPYESLEVAAMTKIMLPHMKTLAPLISESFDGARFPDDIYFNFFNGPPSTSGTERVTRWNVAFKGFRHEEDLDLIHILPLSGRVYNPGTDTSKWYAYDFHYLNQGPYNTSTDLMNAYMSNNIRKVKLEAGFRNTLWDRVFPKRDSSLPLRDNADIHGPRTYYPAGPRYTIEGTHVKWMGWSFDISGSQIRGPALFNINFKNERIIYELAVNDIALNYAMDSHAQNNIIYADATYGIMGGDSPTTVMPGVDCPEHATILNTTFWWHTTQTAYDMRSICIFEADGQDALWRHAGHNFEAGLRNRHLIVRSPVVIGNYDYTFEFHFYLDGKVYTHAKASGYIQSSFWDEGNPHSPDNTRDAFGYRIGEYMTGPIHDHMFGFKVDFDLVDKNNSFQIVKWKAGPVLEALKTQKHDITKAPEYFIYNETRYIEWERIEKEKGIQDPSEQQFWLVINEREKNKWGVERGYQIAPLATGDQALKTHPLLNALSFTKFHCAVTKRKEEESTLTSIYDVNRMEHAQEYLAKHIDGESIVDDDIVNWVTVGFLHVPTTEDMPMTVKVETGFMLRPFNFFDRTASFDMPEHAETKDGIIRESEPSYEQCSEPKKEYCRFC